MKTSYLANKYIFLAVGVQKDLGFQISRMMFDVFANKGCNEVVAVVIAFSLLKDNRHVDCLTSFHKSVRTQVFQKLIIHTL